MDYIHVNLQGHVVAVCFSPRPHPEREIFTTIFEIITSLSLYYSVLSRTSSSSITGSAYDMITRLIMSPHKTPEKQQLKSDILITDLDICMYVGCYQQSACLIMFYRKPRRGETSMYVPYRTRGDFRPSRQSLSAPLFPPRSY